MSMRPNLSAAVPFADDHQENCNDGLPAGYQVRHDGIYRSIEKDGGEDWAWLCTPIQVISLPRSRNGEDWGRLVEILDADGRVHRWAIPAEMFGGDGTDLRRGVLRLGLDLASGQRARQAFMDLLMQWRPKARSIMTDRLGWSDETCSAFTLGDGRTLGNGEIVYQAENVPGVAREMRIRGSLEDWKNAVAALISGNPILVVAVSLAFAGPLLELLALEGGGIHLRGASSRGKSTVQRVATSVWGAPGFMQTWRATDNGLEGAALAANSSLLVLDEMGEVDGRAAGAIAYMLANGQSKTRANRNGHARSPAQWRLMFLSSGEISLADKMIEAGRRAKAGQEVRLLDVRADGQTYGAFDRLHGFEHPAAFADSLNRASAEYYGCAGRAFVQRLIDDRDVVVAQVRAEIEAFQKIAEDRFGLDDADGQVRRVVQRIALVSAAGVLATQFGITSWSEVEAREAAMVILGLWLDGRGGSGSAEARDAIDRIRAFIVEHGASRFERVLPDGCSEIRPIHNRAGWYDDEFFYVATSVWKSEVHAGSDPRRAAQVLAKADLLVPESSSKLTKKTPRTVKGRPRIYAIRATILGEENAENS